MQLKALTKVRKFTMGKIIFMLLILPPERLGKSFQGIMQKLGNIR